MAVSGRIMAAVTGRQWWGETAGWGPSLLLMSEAAVDSGVRWRRGRCAGDLPQGQGSLPQPCLVNSHGPSEG